MLAICFLLVGGPSYISARSQAYGAFRRSRSGQVDSYPFLSYGVTSGMTRQEVAKAMNAAEMTLQNMYQSDPPWDGTVDIYIFKYGPTWQHPLGGHPRVFYEEWYWVYFDPQGRAVKLRRLMVKGEGRDVVVDLQTHKVTAE